MSSEEKNYYLWRYQSDLNFTTPLVHLQLFCDATSKLSVLVPRVFKNPCLIVSYSAIALCSFFCEKCRSIRSRCSFFRICKWFTISWKKVITRGDSDTTRNELHSETERVTNWRSLPNIVTQFTAVREQHDRATWR